MSLDVPRRGRSPSPANSGRDSPLSGHRQARQHLDEELAKTDKPYRRYAALIERALTGFDTARLEWPDYISFLGRLSKAIQAHPPAVDSLPHSSLVANRLSQCLNPTLPSGVHQKTLDVYSYIFSLIGKDGLSRDLHIFLPGISSILSFASLSIRPVFLTLLEKHVLPLNAAALRPALKALILCLLPGLEEETSEDFDRALSIVDGLQAAVNPTVHKGPSPSQGFGDEYFWQCFFLATISGRTRRQGALAFLTRRLPGLGPKAASDSNDTVDPAAEQHGASSELPYAAEAVISPEPGLLIRCFASGLEDDQSLLQRGFLDLLLTHLPLNSPVLVQRVDPQDLQRLVAAATSVVARRDMSLNRRLWSWFLGPDTSEDDADSSMVASPVEEKKKLFGKPTEYFRQYGAEPLTRSVLAMFGHLQGTPAEVAKPYRTGLSLMDRWEIGSMLVPSIFLPAIDNLHSYKSRADDQQFQEVLRSANSFFDGIESGVIWGQIVRLIVSALGTEPLANDARLHKLDLACFVLEHFNVREEEMVAFHIPLACLLLMALLHQGETMPNPDPLNYRQETALAALFLFDQLVDLLPERGQLNSSFGEASPLGSGTLEQRTVDKILSFYQDSLGNLSLSPPPFSSRQIADLTLQICATMAMKSIEADSYRTSQDTRLRTFSILVSKTPSTESVEVTILLRTIKAALEMSAAPSRFPFLNLSSMAQIILNVASKGDFELTRFADLPAVLSLLIEHFWSYLTPSFPKHHVEAVKLLWQLDSISVEDNVLESSVANFLSLKQSDFVGHHSDAEAARRFAILWSQTFQNTSAAAGRGGPWSRRGSVASNRNVSSDAKETQMLLLRPLLLLLDALHEEGSETYFFLLSWLKSLSNMYTVLDVLVTRIGVLLPSSVGTFQSLPGDTEMGLKALNDDQSHACLYYLRHVSNILRLGTESLWVTLSADPTSRASFEEVSADTSLQLRLARRCLAIVSECFNAKGQKNAASLQCSALRILQQLLQNPDSSAMKSLAAEEELVDFLEKSVVNGASAPSVQVALLDTSLSYLKLKSSRVPSKRTHHRRQSSSLDLGGGKFNRASNFGDAEERPPSTPTIRTPPPKKLIQCLQKGVVSPASLPVLESWVSFLVDVLPLFADSLFQNLIPLVETFCKQINTSFETLKATFSKDTYPTSVIPESSLLSLLNGLEHMLAIAHDQLAVEEGAKAAVKSPDQAQGFFGNVVSGVFASDAHKSRSSVANSRLTVVLCLQDAVRVCFSIWSWASYGQENTMFDTSSLVSFGHVGSRLRNRSRHLLDRMFLAEALECLETLVASEHRFVSAADGRSGAKSPVIHLLHSLDGSRAKRMMPAIFNALYSRTNPSALEAGQMSSLTADVKDVDLASFLIDYTESLDDDAMDEIWTDCMTFLKDVLSNPLLHSSILASLLLFLLTLAEKVDNTNFGEQKKMRKELSDIFLRLLAATFTARPASAFQDVSDEKTDSKIATNGDVTQNGRTRPQSVVSILTTVVPRLGVVLNENDKILTAISSISSNVIQPLLHGKTFPDNINLGLLQLLQKNTRVSSAAKAWRRDVSEVFNHPRLFSCRRELVSEGLLPILRQWALNDKDRIPELIGRITAPASAGIMFGVGASAARLEADKKTQLTLRRITLLLLALDQDAVVTHLPIVMEKVNELLSATPASSPSSATRAEIYMLLQATVLRTSSIHLAPLWPLVSAELQRTIASALPRTKDYDTYNTLSLLQACRLLDLLLLLQPDDFQTHEWLFITDTIDSVYHPAQWEPVSLVDELSEELGVTGSVQSPNPQTPTLDQTVSQRGSYKTTFLSLKGKPADMSKEEFVDSTLRPFFAQLSIHSFEATYGMKSPNLKSCRDQVLDDIFDDSTLMG